MPHILIVCTANICRSPVVQTILREHLAARGLGDWTVESAGTWAIPARPAADYSIQLMAEQGLDLSGHRSQIVTAAHLERADLVLCMETGHVEALSVEFPDQAHKLMLLSELAGQHYSIPDPYGGPLPAYRRMVHEVTELIEQGLPELIARAQANAQTRP